MVARPAVDYAPSPTDDSILQLPLKQELLPEDMTNVFGYPRDLRRRHAVLTCPSEDLPIQSANCCGCSRRNVLQLTGSKLRNGARASRTQNRKS